jgi:hypothetical protein
MDPLEFLGQVSHPFCFFGIAPTLFDAPARTARPDMDWECHSFLCCVEGDDRREVRQLTGFSWGFRIASGRVDLFPVTADASWSRHQDLLTRSYPAWRFSRPG